PTPTLFPYTTLFRSHVISNPYRVTELYGFGTAGVNSAPKGTPFPQALEETITSVTEKSIAGFPAAITMATGIERTQPSTAPWIVDRKSTRLNSSHLG